MFKQMKKLLALVLTVLLLINAMPVSALAEVASEWLSIPYSYDDDSAGITGDDDTFTIPVYFYDTVRGRLAETSTSISVEYSRNGSGVTLSSNSAINEVLGDLGTYSSAVLADDDNNIASGVSVSSLRVAREGGYGRYSYYLTSGSGYNSTRLNHEGKNIYIRYTPFNPALQLVSSNVEIATGESKQIVATLLYATAGEAAITWTSSSSNVRVTPDAADPTKAIITGVKAASDVTITVSAAVSGFETASASMNVDVIQGAESVTIYQDGASVNGREYNMETGGETLNLTASVSPSDTSDKTITWTSSNPTVASVKNGVVTTGNHSGSVTISAVAANGVKASVVLHVHEFKLEVEPAVVNIVEEEEFYIYPLISSVTDDWTLTVEPTDPSVVLALWMRGSQEAVLTACDLPEGKTSATTTVKFTLTHTVNGETESKSQLVTVNVAPKAAEEYYTVSLFDMSGVLISSTSVQAGENFTLPTADDMAVEGYTFNGFKNLEDSSAEAYSGTITNINENLILMADYSIIRHKVTFVVHEGEGANPGETVVWVDHGDIVEKPANPAPATQNGYVVTKFIDWHDHHNHTLRNSYDFWTPVTQDITLCAHFEPATYDVMLVTFAGTYQTKAFVAGDSTASVTLPTKATLDATSVSLPTDADIEATHLGGYYTDKDTDATDRKWSYYRFWQVAGTNDTYSTGRNAVTLNYSALRDYAYDPATGEWNDVIINAVYEPDINAYGQYTREYQSLNATIPVRVVTEDGYVLGMGEVYTKVNPSFGLGQGQNSMNGYNTSQVTAKTAKFGTVDLNGKDVTVTDSEGTTATYTIISGADGNLLTNAELVWLCQMENHVYGATSDMPYSYACSGGCWNVLGIVTVVVRLHSDDLRLRVNYYNIPEGGTKDDAVRMKSLFFGNEEGELESGDVLSYLDYVDGIGQTYSYHSHEWIVGCEGAVAQLGNSYVLDIYYTHWPHTVTVNYVFEDGTTAAPTANRTLHKNTYYFIVSPDVEGYVPDIEIVRGKMPGSDVEVTVVYYPVGWLQLEKIVVDKGFNPYGTSFAFLAENVARTTSSSLLVNSFKQNADGTWTGTDLVQLRAGRYAIMEQNDSGEYEVDYSSEFVTVLPENTRDNPAKVTVTNTRKLPVVSIEKTVTSTPANGKFYVLDEEITYQIVVKNTGEAAAEALLVEDALLGISREITLAAGASQTITGSYIVKAADVAAGKVVNVATADNADIDEVSDTVETPAGEDPKPAHTVEKSVVGRKEAYALNDTIHYQITVKNTGNVKLEGIRVVDALVNLDATIDLAVGADETFDVYHTVSSADILAGKVVNVVTAAAGDDTQTDTETVTTEDPETSWSVEKTVTSTPANGEAYGLGEVITYQIVVKNTGNQPIDGLQVVDALIGLTRTIGLEVGESETFTGSYTVKEADIAAGQVANTAAAKLGDDEVTDTETVPTEEANTSWTIEKTVTSTPANGTAYDLGEIITYKVVVKNTGNQVISSLKVEDALIGLNRSIALNIGEERSFEGSHKVTSEDIANKKVVNVAAASVGNDKQTDTETVPTVQPVSGLEIDKIVTSTPANGASYNLGEVIRYKITVKNTGNQPLYNVPVKDALIGLDTATDLLVGEEKEFTGEYAVTSADIANKQVVNVASAGDEEDTETVPTVDPVSSLKVDKTVENRKEKYALGETVEYSITVKNTGNQPLYNVPVKDALIKLDTTTDLPVGAFKVFTGEYVVTEADIARGSIVNVVTAGSEQDTETVTTDPAAPAFVLSKAVTSTSAQANGYALGETITFRITIKNTGNQTLRGLKVVDALVGLEETIDLAIGEIKTYDVSYKVTEADIQAEKVVNVVTVNDKEATATADTDSPNPHATIQKEVTSTPANGSSYALGETIRYRITVKNTGNVKLENLLVEDKLIGLSKAIDLSVGAAETFEGSHRVTEADIKAGKVVNVATAGGKESNEVIVPTEGEKPGWTIAKSVTSQSENAAGYRLGETISYRIDITNTGNVKLEGLLVEDELIGLSKAIDLSVGATAHLTGSYKVTADDIAVGYVKNVATAGGKESNEVTVPTEEEKPDWTIVKRVTSTPANGSSYALGELVTYSITVKNTGNVKLEGLAIVDEMIGLSRSVNLAVGGSEVFTGSYRITEADIKAGSVKNVATAGDKQDEETIITEEEKPNWTAVKSVTSRPANGSSYALGETIRYRITVKNIGNVRLDNLQVVDAKIGLNRSVSLAVGESEEFTGSHVVTEADIKAGSVKNVATVGGKDTNEVTVDTDDPNPDVTITKTTTSSPRNGSSYALGEKISYLIVVRNTGNVKLENIVVEDALIGLKETISLEIGAVKNFTGSYTVTEADILAGKVVNTAAAMGETTTVDDPTDPVKKDLSIVKTAISTPANGEAYGLGEKISYQIVVRNTGNVTQTNLVVEDELTRASWNIASLAPGASARFTTSHVVMEADILAGKVVNVATVGNESTTEEVETEEVKSSLSVDKITTSTPANGEAYAVGEAVTYQIVVKNTGNVTISDITVRDIMTADTWTIPSLAPGASRSFNATHVVLEDEILAGKVVNIATAQGTDPEGGKPEGSDTTEDPTEPANPEIQVNKTITSTPKNPEGYAVGEEITYGILVRNTGNLRLIRVVVEDALTGDEWYIEALPRGYSRYFTASYVVTEDDLIAGSVLNVVTAAGNSADPKNPTVEDEDEVEADTIPSNPEIKVTKTVTSTPADGEAYKLGETITYRIVVHNTGNITVKNINVEDELTGDAWEVAELVPGKATYFTASYVVTEADLIAGSVINVATAKGESDDPKDPTPGGEDEIETDVEDSDPEIKVIKIVTSTPADGEAYKLGETITYRIVVHNTGNITVKNVAVEDELTGDAWEVAELAPGKATYFTASYVVTEADLIAGSVINVATAKGESDDPKDPTPGGEDEIETDVEDSDPEIKVIKIVTSTPADGKAYKLGETITYRIVVHNTGNITVKNVAVEDELTGDAWEVAELAPGKAEYFTASYVVTEADLIAGSVINVATAKGESDDPKDPTPGGEDEIETDVEDSDPEIKVIKIVTSTPADGEAYKLGETISYRIVVHNTGNITVKNVAVEDELTGDAWEVAELAPGKAEYFTASYVVTEADLIAGSVINVATAKGESDDPKDPTPGGEDEIETDVEDSDPAVEVIKTVTNPKDKFKLDETIEYAIEVRNAGNITVHNITVEDELTGDTWTIESLAPGASETFTAKHTVTEADTRAGKVVNVATATGGSEDPDEPTVEDEGEVVVEIAEIVIKKATLGRVVMNIGDCFE